MTTLLIIGAVLIVLIACLHKLGRTEEERQFIATAIATLNLTDKNKGELEKRLAKLG